MPDQTALSGHLSGQYGIRIVGVTRLQPWCPFVHRIDRLDDTSWVARVFPAAVPVERVEGDAEVLRLLEDHAYPAERLAHSEPVSIADDCPVLLTEFVEGDLFGDRTYEDSTAAFEMLRTLGAMLGRLHALPTSSPRVARDAGAWHGDLDDGLPRQDVVAALAMIDDARERVPLEYQARYESLRAQLADTDRAENLPLSLIHPDYAGPNIILTRHDTPVVIDWSGAGRGPRLTSFAWFLNQASLRKEPAAPTVDAIAEGYGSMIEFDDQELRRLASVMRIRPLFQATRSFWRAVTNGRSPSGPGLSWCTREDNELRDAIAARAVDAFGGVPAAERTPIP